jgi:peptidoglycan/LPS O-acetylase OafA/YrhL
MVGDPMQRKRVHELDYMRGWAIICVVTLHVLGFFYTDVPAQSPLHVIDGFTIYIFRFSRQIFMFLTGFVLVYNYLNRTFQYRTFLWKRTRAIVIPYILWSFFYVAFSMYFGAIPKADNFKAYLLTSVQAVLTGDAFYHLYYVVVTVQFYLIFPLLLYFVKRMNHPKRWLIFSGISYTALMGWFYWGINHGLDPRTWNICPDALKPILTDLIVHRDRLWFSYYGYYILGAFAAVYLPTWRTIISRYHKWFFAGALLFITLFFSDYEVHVVHGVFAFATKIDVLKPTMFIYTLFVIAGLYYWALHIHSFHPTVQLTLQKMAHESFGIFLIHPIMIFAFESYGVPFLKLAHVPHITQVVLTIIMGLAGSYFLSHFLRTIPVLSWMVGTARIKRQLPQLPFHSLHTTKNMMEQK